MKRYFFISFLLLLFAINVSAQLQYRYWFDGDDGTHTVTGSLSGDSQRIVLDVPPLSGWMHQLNFQFCDETGRWSSPQSAYFTLQDSAEAYTHHFWFDDSPELMTIPGGSSSMTLDASDLPLGLHTLNYIASGSSGTTQVKSAVFARLMEFDSNDLSGMKVHAFADNDSLKQYPCSIVGRLIHIDMDFSYLKDGVHKLTIILEDEASKAISVLSSSYFFKVSSEDSSISKFMYWFNDDMESVVTVDVNSQETPYHIYGLWDVKSYPFRSESFSLSVEAGRLVAYAVNQFNAFALSEDGAIASPVMTSPFSDMNVSRDYPLSEVIALAPCEGKSIGWVEENQIKWFSLQVGVGDSLTFKANTPCAMDLFSASGKRLWSCQGGDATFASGLHVWEEGTCYLAVHDTQYADEVTLDYTLIDRYCLLEHTPDSSAKGDILVLDLTGNGFEDLKRVELVTADTAVAAYEVDVKDYGKAYAKFNLLKYPKKEEVFDLRLTFGENGEDEVLVKDGFTLMEMRKGEIKVEVLPSYRVSTPYDVTIRITNTGNVPYWGVPFNIGLDKTGAGSVMEFKNFTPYVDETLADSIPIGYFTENFLGTKEHGWFFPMMIPYIGAEEVIDLTIGFVGEAHKRVNLYAWTGEPWSEGFQKFTTLNYCFADYLDPKLNYVTAGQMCLHGLLSMADSTVVNSNSQKRTKRYAPDRELQDVIENMERANDPILDLAEDEIRNNLDKMGAHGLSEAIQELGDGNIVSGLAEANANVAIATGMAIGGTINGLRLRNSDPSLYGIDPSDETYSALFEYRDNLRHNMPHPSSILMRAFGMEMPDCAENPNPRPRPHEVEILQEFDPNDIYGYKSESGSEYIGINVKELPYCIEFENSPELANAAANLIVVEDVLNPEIFDLDTFTPTTVTFGKYEVSLHGEQEYAGTVDMRPAVNALAEVKLSIDKKTGKMTCSIKSLDPMTLEHTTHYQQGVLPVNKANGEGIGTINFTVALKKSVGDGVSVDNVASIVFGTHEAIETHIWHNVTDFARPASRVSNIEVLSPSEIELTLDSYDAGSGIWKLDLYCSTDSCQTWTCMAEGITESRYKVSVTNAKEYHFASIAADRAGNIEVKELRSEAFYKDGVVETSIVDVLQSNGSIVQGWYNLHGQKFKNALRPGIYIIDGKKIIIR